jgi:hypothetical protein
MIQIILYIILGLLAAFVLFIVFAEFYGYFVHGMPMDFFTPETDEQRIKRYEKRFNRKLRRKRFRLLWPEDENQDMFGNPM